MAYDSPNAEVRREINTPAVTGVASTSVQKFTFFQKTRIKKVHALINVIGTNVAAGFDILNGTDSIGEIVCGTDAAGTLKSSALLNSDILPGGLLDIKGKASSATLNVCFAIEHEVDPDAVKS